MTKKKEIITASRDWFL